MKCAWPRGIRTDCSIAYRRWKTMRHLSPVEEKPDEPRRLLDAFLRFVDDDVVTARPPDDVE